MITDVKLSLDILRSAIADGAAALRCRRVLQPGGGPGTKVFPPTYAGAVYSTEDRRLPDYDKPVRCVLLDSVQSQANRMEEALSEAILAGKLELPNVVVDFTGANLVEAIGQISALQVPHRLADAILRDSLSEGVPFRESPAGKPLNEATPQNATPLYQLCPTALIFGMWDSTGPKGGLGAKFERAVVSEVVGINVPDNPDLKNRGVRRDPLEIRAKVGINRKEDNSWTVAAKPDAKGVVKPSAINHSSVPFDSDNAGVTVERAEQSTTISLICLRRLQFPIGGQRKPEVDRAAQTVLAALALCAAALAFENGMGLRSRSLLWPNEVMTWELLAKPGQSPQSFVVSAEDAQALLAEAVAAAESTGLKWQDKALMLKPSPNLLELVRKSQEQAVKEGSAEDA